MALESIPEAIQRANPYARDTLRRVEAALSAIRAQLDAGEGTGR